MSEKFDIILVRDLLDEVSEFDLYPQLVLQLQKDINRAGIEYTINPEIKAKDLVRAVQELLLDRLQNEFNEYMNLLYAVDVSEAAMRNFESEKIDDIAAYATYLILKREWKKVWLRFNSMNP